jgi:hypothetical protein
VKKILIITPHYPPSNLASVHRSRLFAMHLPSFGWKPIILTVDEKHYEEEPDWNLFKLLPREQHIEKAEAFRLTKPRLIGDIGLRAFLQLRRKALALVKKEKIDFVYILIPSFYASLIGPYLYRKTGVKYGIDYIDPWVHHFPGSDKTFSRHWWSTKLSGFLEPKAVKKASLITGVAQGYFEAVVKRNPHLKEQCVFGAMPYGGEASDHRKLEQIDLKPYLFQKNKKLQLVYAGAMLPKAFTVLEAIFHSIAGHKNEFENVEFHFIGTGKSPAGENGYNIKPLAEKAGLWGSVVFEHPKRIPYLDVLVHLNLADAVFILGSTERHYTPSKTYQAVLSKKPVLAVLNKHSSAVDILRSTGAGEVLAFDGEEGVDALQHSFSAFFGSFLSFHKNYQPEEVDMSLFENYSAKEVTRQLALLLDKAVEGAVPKIS